MAALQNLAHPRACVDWAVTKLVQSLGEAGIAAGEEDIIVERRPDGSAREKFSISITGTRVLVSGSDSRGTMYGVFELAEQIANSGAHGSWKELVAHLVPASQSPFLTFRADNSFLHELPTSSARWADRLHLAHTPLLFDDSKMWEQYIDMLAANRFNTLDLHGGYNLRTTQFFNLLPALVSVPGFEGVGDARMQKRNLSALRHVIRYARKRGMAVALMNYSAALKGLSHTQLVEYTRKAVLILQKEIPELKQLGFRVGESGEELSFYRDTYVRAIRDSGRRDLRLYTRSWRATPAEMDKVSEAVDGALDVEIKFNGEHLGLPYQGILGPAHNRYGYGDFLWGNAQYRVIWQVRANGTHRFWTWAQTDFIRRTIRSCKLGGAEGFSMEPPTAYFTNNASDYYRDTEDQSVYRYIWEKHWPWYFAWGRLAYNPDLPAEIVVARYTARLGTQGAVIYQALQESGKIVPLVMSYRFVGPDQRNTSPETQTGAFDPEKAEPIDALTYARNTPMDSRSFVGVDAFVGEKMAGTPDGRIAPPHVANLLARAAREARQHVARIREFTGRASDEWRLMRADILGASYLGEYHAARISGTMYLDYALRQNSEADYNRSLEYLSLSRLAWGQLSQVCDSTYKPLDDPLLGQSAYTWDSQIRPLRNLDSTVVSMWAARAAHPPGTPLALTARDSGASLDVEVGEVTQTTKENGTREFSCSPIPDERVKKVTLWLKGAPSAARWAPFNMNRGLNGVYTVEVPHVERGSLGLLEITNTENDAAQFPDVLQATPYWVIGDRSGTP